MEQMKDESKEEKGEGVWVVAMYDGTHGIIGLVSGKKSLTDNVRQQVLMQGKSIELDLAFDYIEMMKPVQVQEPDGSMGMRISREPIISTVGFTSSPCRTYVAEWKRLIFISDMAPVDRALYTDFISKAIQAATSNRVERSGLALPTPEEQSAVAASAVRLPDQNGRPHFKVDLRDGRR